MTDAGEAGVLERLERLEQKVDRLDTRLDGLDTRIDGLDTRIDGLDTRIGLLDTRIGHLDTRIDRLENRLSEKIETQGRKFEIQMEELRETVVKFAENLGGRLDTMSQQLTNNQRYWESRFSDHDRALRDHNRRITTLERRQRK